MDLKQYARDFRKRLMLIYDNGGPSMFREDIAQEEIERLKKELDDAKKESLKSQNFYWNSPTYYYSGTASSTSSTWSTSYTTA